MNIGLADTTKMKLSREYRDEHQARAYEVALRNLGYCAWRNPKRDGTWAVFWVEQLNQEKSTPWIPFFSQA